MYLNFSTLEIQLKIKLYKTKVPDMILSLARFVIFPST